MAYTTIDKPSDYFNTVLYAGNSSTQAITGVGFAPNWVWLRERTQASDHCLFDTVRGANKDINSNDTSGEATTSNKLTAFGSDGFTLGNSNTTNQSGQNNVSWNWKAGTSFTNDASGTGIGSIDSSGSFNNTSGFSIVSWTGTGSAGTIKHGLNSTPKTIIIKRTDTIQDWAVLHAGIATDFATDYLILNKTNAAADHATWWNDTAPTSSVFTVGTNGSVNSSETGATYIGYVFSEKQGYSKFSSYTGNGNADGTFVYTGFKPAFVMAKRSNSASAGNWNIRDSKRSPSNVASQVLEADSSAAEGTATGTLIDIYSNGFKPRNGGSGVNAGSSLYIYMAFAENPFVTSTGVPATAR
jgi:hypothetical protein